jgi:hypothetical protein
MKRLFTTLGTFLVILLTVFSAAPQSVIADGMMIKHDPYSDRWDYSGETNQHAFINYEDGLEKMILSVGMEETSGNAVWIFPIPSEPNKVVIDVVTKLPLLSGEEITKKAKSNLLDIKKALPATQIYTIPFILGMSMAKGRAILSADLEAGGDIETDVKVYEHLEKKGITTEIITAKTAQSLYRYLQGKGLKVEEGAIPVLDHYIGKEFTFVVSWISETATEKLGLRTTQRGVFVTFPTQEIYYPLLPTSVYGSEVVPATVRIIGHRSPKIFKDIKSYTKTEYYVDSYVITEEELKSFYNGPDEKVKYTKVEIKAPSKYLTDDLWIGLETPLGTYYPAFIAQHALLSGAILLILSSMTTCIAAGLIVFSGLRNKIGILKLALVGLSNCLSIAGLAIATVLFRTKARDESIAPLLNEIRQNGYVWKRRVAVILFFADLPFLIFGGLFLPSFVQQIMLYFRYGFFSVNIMIIYIIPLMVLAITIFIKRIKTKGRPLFSQLIAANYSSWSFNPKDKMKLAFIPLFSIGFLLISWVVAELVKMTV